MNQAASCLANEKELCQATGKKGFFKAEKGKKKEIINKACIVSGKVAFLRGMEGPIE